MDSTNELLQILANDQRTVKVECHDLWQVRVFSKEGQELVLREGASVHAAASEAVMLMCMWGANSR
jgi:hypothetical protein